MSKSKIDKVESFDLERIVSDGDFVSGNVYYDTGNGHAPHLDLHVNKVGKRSYDYRLYNPVGGNDFEMFPGENVIFKK